MSSGQAIDLLKFWLDEQADWWNRPQYAIALNRAVNEWVIERLPHYDQTEQRRAELSQLIAPPLEGRGTKILMNPVDNMWLVMALSAYAPSQQWVEVKPITLDQEAKIRRSFFWSPSEESPCYVSEAYNGVRLLRFLPEVSMRYSLVYLRQPKVIDSAKPNELWNDFPDWARESIIQRAKRMLLQQKAQDYSAQVQIETRP